MRAGTALKRAKAAPVPTSKASPRMERFERYLEKFRRPIFTYVYRLVRDEATAEDIAQETFVRLYKQLDKIRDQTASAWLYRVARNLVTDYIRKKRPVTFTVLRGRAREDDDESPSLQFEHPGRGPVGTTTNNELRDMIEETLEAMSPKFRDVLELVDVQKMTHEEASQVLDCSVKTVSARLARAREFFTNRIGRFVDVDDGDEPDSAAGG
ncbi:MAG: sigma-70 family RNA polymerase sigma factor [Planctomycetes bacterium]|nr:sigma-70 family RNA polymerase sigma factor [Planctomycetota bacterium]MCA8936618.1 sigma-70 family RNA polymerase sigma factor [Planctomycetota bacterium]